MTGLNLIGTLVTLAVCVYVHYGTYKKAHMLKLCWRDVLIMLLLLCAGLAGAGVAILAAFADKWEVFMKDAFVFKKKETDEEVEGDDQAGE